MNPKELILSENLEDVILGIRILTKSEIDEIFYLYHNDEECNYIKIQKNLRGEHNLVVRTDLGWFFIHGKNLYYEEICKYDFDYYKFYKHKYDFT